MGLESRTAGQAGAHQKTKPPPVARRRGSEFLIDYLGPLRRALTYAYYAYYSNDVDRQGECEKGHEVIYKTSCELFAQQPENTSAIFRHGSVLVKKSRDRFEFAEKGAAAKALRRVSQDAQSGRP